MLQQVSGDLSTCRGPVAGSAVAEQRDRDRAFRHDSPIDPTATLPVSVPPSADRSIAVMIGLASKATQARPAVPAKDRRHAGLRARAMAAPRTATERMSEAPMCNGETRTRPLMKNRAQRRTSNPNRRLRAKASPALASLAPFGPARRSARKEDGGGGSSYHDERNVDDERAELDGRARLHRARERVHDRRKRQAPHLWVDRKRNGQEISIKLGRRYAEGEEGQHRTEADGVPGGNPAHLGEYASPARTGRFVPRQLDHEHPGGQQGVGAQVVAKTGGEPERHARQECRCGPRIGRGAIERQEGGERPGHGREQRCRVAAEIEQQAER